MANIVTLPIVYVDGQVLTASDLNQNFNALNSATIPVSNGGTGLTAGTSGGVPYFSSATAIGSSGALTQYGVVYGGGAGAAPNATAAGTTNTVLHGNTSAAPTYSAVVEADITLADNTTNNVSTTKHGFAPKAPNDATRYLDGTGAYSIPAGVALVADTATRTAGDVTTGSASLVDLTGASITLTTGARRVFLSFTCTTLNSGANTNFFTFDIDGSLAYGTDGMGTEPNAGGSAVTLTFLTALLSAGAHTFKVQWRTSGGTATVEATATRAYHFAAQETPFTT